MKSFTYPSTLQAAAFLDGVRFVNDSAITLLGVRQLPAGGAEALLKDADYDDADDSVGAVPTVQQTTHSTSVDHIVALRRNSFELGYQSVLEDQCTPAEAYDATCPYFQAGKAAAWRAMVDYGSKRVAEEYSDEYWLEHIQQLVFNPGKELGTPAPAPSVVPADLSGSAPQRLVTVVLSTCHVAPDETARAYLDHAGHPLEHGWLWSVPGRAPELRAALQIPSWLTPILALADASGFHRIEFDADGEVLSELPTYTWP